MFYDSYYLSYINYSIIIIVFSEGVTQNIYRCYMLVFYYHIILWGGYYENDKHYARRKYESED